MAARQRRRKSSDDSPSPLGQEPGAACEVPIDFHKLFELAADAMFVMTDRGRFLDANQVACHLTGYSRVELLEMHAGDLSPVADRQDAAKRCDQLLREGRMRTVVPWQRKDGKVTTVEINATALGDGTFLSSARAASEQFSAKPTLDHSCDAHAALFDLCQVAVVSAGPDGVICSWNSGAEEIFGYTAVEAIGLALDRLVPDAVREEHACSFSRQVARTDREGFSCKFEAEGLHKDGSHIPVEISVGVGWVGDQRALTAVIRDIRAHRNIVEELDDALQRLRFHVERMPLAYIVWDVDFRVTEWNSAAERLFGFTKEEALQRRAYDLIVPGDVVPAVEPIWSDLLAGDMSSHSINTNVRKDGSRLCCEWFNTPLRDSQGRVYGVASMAVDATTREALESRIRDAQRLESLGVLAGGVAHDFNSSLMVILGNTALLRAVRGLPARAIEHIELIEESGSRASELIKHLLAYARTGRHNPQPTDLNAVVQDALKLVRASLGVGYELSLDLAESLPSIVVDRSQIEQIVLNLCLNAKEAMLDGGTIALTTRKAELSVADAARCVPFNALPGEYVELLVGDTGCGMDRTTISRMFDPFFTTKADGHGLGMASVLGILRQHAAAGLVESERGKSTDFHVFLPIPKDAQAAGEIRRTRRRLPVSKATRARPSRPK